jgi:hypothetical protein
MNRTNLNNRAAIKATYRDFSKIKDNMDYFYKRLYQVFVKHMKKTKKLGRNYKYYGITLNDFNDNIHLFLPSEITESYDKNMFLLNAMYYMIDIELDRINQLKSQRKKEDMNTKEGKQEVEFQDLYGECLRKINNEMEVLINFIDGKYQDNYQDEYEKSTDNILNLQDSYFKAKDKDQFTKLIELYNSTPDTKKDSFMSVVSNCAKTI